MKTWIRIVIALIGVLAPPIAIYSGLWWHRGFNEHYFPNSEYVIWSLENVIVIAIGVYLLLVAYCGRWQVWRSSK